MPPAVTVNQMEGHVYEHYTVIILGSWVGQNKVVFFLLVEVARPTLKEEQQDWKSITTDCILFDYNMLIAWLKAIRYHYLGVIPF